MISSTWKQLVCSNSTQRSACRTWKGINLRATQAQHPFSFILECIILSCPISCHLAPVQLLPPLRLDVSACWLRLMDVAAWHLGFTWPALFGNRSVPVVLIRRIRLGAGDTTWLSVPRLLSSQRHCLPCAIHLLRLLLLSSTSPGEVRRVFRWRSQDVQEPLFVWKEAEHYGRVLLSTRIFFLKLYK